jgi:hypothetical protein
MGLEQLPNGMTYFNFSEELQIWTAKIYEIITPINLAIAIILTFILVAMIIGIAFHMAKQQIEDTSHE